MEIRLIPLKPRKVAAGSPDPLPADLEARFRDAVGEGGAESPEVMVMLACTCLEAVKAVSFHVRAFGEQPWNVDVGCDLSTIVEQSVALGRWWRDATESEFELDFYEQGVERSLLFRRSGDALAVRCVSRTRWKPHLDEVILPSSWLPRTFGDLVRTFIAYARQECAPVIETAGFLSWATEASEVWASNDGDVARNAA